MPTQESNRKKKRDSERKRQVSNTAAKRSSLRQRSNKAAKTGQTQRVNKVAKANRRAGVKVAKNVKAPAKKKMLAAGSNVVKKTDALPMKDRVYKKKVAKKQPLGDTPPGRAKRTVKKAVSKAKVSVKSAVNAVKRAKVKVASAKKNVATKKKVVAKARNFARKPSTAKRTRQASSIRKRKHEMRSDR